MTEHIRNKAEEFVRIYEKAISLGTTVDSAQHAKAIQDCYVSKDFVVLSHGSVQLLNSNETGLANTKAYLDRWAEVGAGVNYKLVSHRIEVVSGTSAMCFLTWSVVPPAGSSVEGWEWENVYFFRLLPGEQTGWWEGCISDNEIGTLLQRFPDFLSGLHA